LVNRYIQSLMGELKRQTGVDWQQLPPYFYVAYMNAINNVMPIPIVAAGAAAAAAAAAAPSPAKRTFEELEKAKLEITAILDNRRYRDGEHMRCLIYQLNAIQRELNALIAEMGLPLKQFGDGPQFAIPPPAAALAISPPPPPAAAAPAPAVAAAPAMKFDEKDPARSLFKLAARYLELRGQLELSRNGFTPRAAADAIDKEVDTTMQSVDDASEWIFANVWSIPEDQIKLIAEWLKQGDEMIRRGVAYVGPIIRFFRATAKKNGLEGLFK